MDPTLVRLIAAFSIPLTSGIAIPIYFLAVLVIPNEPWNGDPYEAGRGQGRGGEGPWKAQGYNSWKDWRRAEKYYRKAQRYGWTPPQERPYENEYAKAAGQNAAGSDLDDMMKDIEKKAMWKEIEELRSKVAQYEKQQKQSKGDV
jgi:hypothetical protein